MKVQPTADFNKAYKKYTDLSTGERQRLLAWVAIKFRKKDRFGEISMFSLARYFGTYWVPSKRGKRKSPIGAGQNSRHARWFFSTRGEKYLDRALKESEDWANGFKR